MTSSVEAAAPRRSGPGRPRAEGIDEKILHAALELIDQGRPVTVNAVVTTGGVSRAALYRRWPSITDLVAAALDHGRSVVEFDVSGDIKSTLMDGIFTRLAESRGVTYTQRRFRKRLELVMADQDLQWAYWNSHVRRRRVSMLEALQTAIDRGELREDLDVDASLDALLGTFYYQYVVRGSAMDDPEALARCRYAFELTWSGMQA